MDTFVKLEKCPAGAQIKSAKHRDRLGAVNLCKCLLVYSAFQQTNFNSVISSMA